MERIDNVCKSELYCAFIQSARNRPPELNSRQAIKNLRSVACLSTAVRCSQIPRANGTASSSNRIRSFVRTPSREAPLPGQTCRRHVLPKEDDRPPIIVKSGVTSLNSMQLILRVPSIMAGSDSTSIRRFSKALNLLRACLFRRHTLSSSHRRALSAHQSTSLFHSL